MDVISWAHTSWACALQACTSLGVNLMGMHLTGVVCFEAFRFLNLGKKSTVRIRFRRHLTQIDNAETNASPRKCSIRLAIVIGGPKERGEWCLLTI
jgi:hypothetical protein